MNYIAIRNGRHIPHWFIQSKMNLKYFKWITLLQCKVLISFNRLLFLQNTNQNNPVRPPILIEASFRNSTMLAATDPTSRRDVTDSIHRGQGVSGHCRFHSYGADPKTKGVQNSRRAACRPNSSLSKYHWEILSTARQHTVNLNVV